MFQIPFEIPSKYFLSGPSKVINQDIFFKHKSRFFSLIRNFLQVELSSNTGFFIDEYSLNLMIARAKGKDSYGHLIDWKAFTKCALIEVYGRHLSKYSSRGSDTKLAINHRFRKALHSKIKAF